MRHTRGNRRCRAARRGQQGLTLIEVLIASVVVTILTLGAAAAFSETVGGAKAARSMTSGVLFLETVSENVNAQASLNLLGLDGTQSFDGTNANDSEFRVDITVFEVINQLVQIDLALTELSTGRRLGTVTTQRSLL